MKIHYYISTILSGMILVSTPSFGQTPQTNPNNDNNNIVTDTVKKTNPAAVKDQTSIDKNVESFLDHINSARVALAMQNSNLAKQHVTEARTTLTKVKNLTAEQRRVSQVRFGSVTYNYGTEKRPYYFPVKTGPVKFKELDTGSKNSLAVSDAEMVYLTVDLTDNQADKYLDQAETALKNNDLKAADENLDDLTDDIIDVDSKVSLPLDKARDNIALARHFIQTANYDGARYALSHADDALDELEDSNQYQARKATVTTMRKNVQSMENLVSKKDPTMLEKADAELNQWWEELKSWAQ
ncbi:MAG: YfdX family protein [Alphaproteobacteria bacterium]|nr:YfdX family protein [Alphaproteobacteria bacterium]